MTERKKEGRAATCRQIKSGGSRCQAKRMTGSDFCFFHNPKAASKRTAARRAGGMKSRPTVLDGDTPDLPLKNAEDVAALLALTINQVRRGELDPKISNAVGYLTGILLKAIEQGDVEERLQSLEAIVKQQDSRPGSIMASDPQTDASFFERGSLAS